MAQQEALGLNTKRESRALFEQRVRKNEREKIAAKVHQAILDGELGCVTGEKTLRIVARILEAN
jgi:hypothetical protein